ncbi:MAG: patatin-like phospholipase family protein [Acidimicrobiales bacterium]|nr:patatin-like phospholipase family protein [Acidimicrobiales bacterium]
MSLLGSILPAGPVSMSGHIRDGSLALLMQSWPDALWLCATRRDDGSRVAFGRGGPPEATLAEAIAASCAVPAYLAPVTIDGTEYLDGGLYSPTNADLLADHDLDLVVIVSPLSGIPWGFDRGLRRWAGRRLRREVRALRAAGTDVVYFEPSRATSRICGLNPMSRDRIDQVLLAAYLEAGRHIADPSIRGLLAPVDRRPDKTRHVAAAPEAGPSHDP